jgi:GGDEF domain-containing protein
VPVVAHTLGTSPKKADLVGSARRLSCPTLRPPPCGRLAERLRSTIEDSAFEVGNRPPIVVTISIGMSEFGCDGDTLDELLSVADQRLYRAKHEGRSRMIAA